MARRASRRCRLSLALVALAVGAAGCSQTTTQQVTEATLAGPMVLNSATGTTMTDGTMTDGGTAVAPAAPVTATASAAPTAAPQATAPKPATTPTSTIVSTPAPAQPTALQSEPMPTTATAASEDDGQFPNINKPPTQPSGTLLPDAARAQIISELEALRAKQSPPAAAGDAGGKPSDLASQASTHGQAAIQQIEACSQDGALENNPDCAPAD